MTKDVLDALTASLAHWESTSPETIEAFFASVLPFSGELIH
jgi:hypothetical protein